MFMFILSVVFVIAAIVLGIVSVRLPKENSYGYSLDGARFGTRIGAGVAAVLAVGTLFFASTYTQDEGEVNVLRSFTGEVVGQDLDAGFGVKAPWVDTRNFDIRNQMVAFVGDGTQNYNGSTANGPQITTQDAEGATVNLDVVINYSINPEAVTSIYTNFQTQENFRARFIEQDVRSVVRDIPNSYGTLEVLTQRAEIGTAIQNRLAERWAERGVVIESVSLQEIRYSEEVRASFDQAQQARINVEREEANLAAAEIQAQQQVVQSTAQAEANRILAESLTEPILQQRYLDTLRELAAEGNVVVVPEGFNGLVNVR